MNRKDLIFAAIAAAVVALFIFLSVVGRHGKAMSSRPEHAGLGRNTPREDCLACHAPDATVAPMPARHPKKGKPPDKTTPCHACHKPPEQTATALLLHPTGKHTHRSSEVMFTWQNPQHQ